MKIVVLATHRSGTSTVAGLINRMGAFAGDDSMMMPATNDNPKGYFERNDVVSLNDRILASRNCEWDKIYAWPDNPKATDRFDPEIEAIVADLDRHENWVIKDPRLCLTWTYWARVVENPVFVLVYRNPVEIARSLHTRDGLSLPVAMALWEAYTVGASNVAAGSRVIRVDYHALLGDPAGEASRLHDALSALASTPLLPFDSAMPAEFISTELNRSGRSNDEAADLMNGTQEKLGRLFRGGDELSRLSVSVGGRAALQDREAYEALLSRYQKVSAENERLRFVEAEFCQQGEVTDRPVKPSGIAKVWTAAIRRLFRTDG